MTAMLSFPILIEQGATLRNARFRYSTQATPADPRVPVDLTGCTIRLDVRDRLTLKDYHRFTTADGSITLDDQTQLPSDGLTGRGWYQLHMDAATSAAQVWSHYRATGQLEITFTSGTVVRHWQAVFILSPETTYDPPI